MIKGLQFIKSARPGKPVRWFVYAWKGGPRIMTAEGPRTRLVVEERGLPETHLHFHASGWQVHLEDLGRSLASGASVHPEGWSAQVPAAAWKARWEELMPAYREDAS